MRSSGSHLLVGGCIAASLCLQASAASLNIGVSEKGTLGAVSQSNAYTFVANAGDVFDFTATATTGSLSPRLRLYNASGTLLASANPGACNGSTIEMNTVRVETSGTYTLLVGDCSSTRTGEYYLYAQRLNTPVGATNLPFGQPVTGTIGLPADSTTYTFNANVNDDVVITVDVKAGTASPKVRIYAASNGTLVASANPGACNGSTIEMSTIQVPATGAYTVLVGDCSDRLVGTYDMYAQRTDHPSGAANLPFGQTQTGAIVSPAESDSYIFSASAGDIVNFTMVATSGTLSPRIRLYRPDGTLLNSANPGACNGPAVEMNNIQLPAAGTYTVLAGDCSNTRAGNYNLYAQRINKPSGASNLPLGQTQTGLIAAAAQSNTYTFSATAKDVMNFTVVTTTGSLSPRIRLYKPDGAPLGSANPGACNGGVIELNTVSIPVTGLYTVLVGDCSERLAGNYDVYAQRTNNPPGSASVLFGQTQSGMIGAPAESDTYVFSASATTVVSFTMVATSGNLSPKIRLYKPDGMPLGSANPGACHGSVTELNAVQIPAPGTYTLLIGDCSDRQIGNYNLSSQCFGSCLVTPPITWPAPAPITYGTRLSTTQLNAASTVAGTFVYTPALGTVLPSGIRTLSVTFTPTDTTRYAAITKTVQIAVNKAMLTLTASNASRPFGTPNPAFAYTMTGFANGESKSVVAGTPILSTTATLTSPVGTYPITVALGTLSAANYSFRFVNGILTVTAAQPVAAAPVFNPGSGTYSSVQMVTLTDAAPAAAIYYTTDGKIPTTSSTRYAGPITVQTNQTIKGIAVAPGYASSPVVTAAYTVVGSPTALAAPATLISTSGGTLNAIVNTFGVTGTYSFQYGTSSAALNTRTAIVPVAASAKAVPVSTPVTGLLPKTRYYYRVVVTSIGGMTMGAVLSFVTN